MKLAIMQPYLFPYIGYFQLLATVDKFVFYDDVNFIKNGWINRNRLVLAGATRYMTIPLSGASPFLKINQIDVQAGDGWRRKLVESVRHSYAKAPHFAAVNSLFQEVVCSDAQKIGEIAKASVTAVARYLGLEKNFVASSAIYGNESLSGQARVLDICAREGASDYYNPPGGRALYSGHAFEERGIGLHFIAPRLDPYAQFADTFEPGLSIIDILMFNERDRVREMIRTETTA